MKNRVVIAGWGQVTQAKEQKDPLLDPLGLMAAASRKAAEACGSPEVLKQLDAVMVVMVLSRYYASAAAQLSEKIGATPRLTRVSKIGGNSPQSLINKAAGMIARGELDRVLIAGGETFYPRGPRDFGDGNALFQGLTGDREREDMIGATEVEMRHGIRLPIHGFPLYETALWAQSGLDLEAYLKQVATLWSKFSHVAARHPNAWSKTPRSSREIITHSESNRLIAFPYPKFMNSLISVDLGAAVVLMSEEKARQIQPTHRGPVYFSAGAYTEDRQRFLIQKSNFTSSLPLQAAAQKALQRSRLSLDDIECFDLYSCFPCAVTIACRMLGIQQDDPRPLTLTGGLGFFGGPGNNYSLHAVATLADAISCGKYNTGMITSLGWFMHKHAVGIYSASPRDTELSSYDLEDETDFLVGHKPVKITDRVSGQGIIETYTVVYARDGSPTRAIIYGTTEKGQRFVAQAPRQPDIYEALTKQSRVGQPVRLRHRPHQNLNLAELI